MVVTELIKIKNGVYTYEYRPQDEHARGEFTVDSNAKLLEIIQLAEGDKTRIYFDQAVMGVRSRFRNEGSLPQKVVRVWL